VSKQSLLLVDGDTRSLRVLEVSLRKAGFMVTAAQSVQDALEKLELHAPDLIISETTFPDGDGFELRRRVRATPEWSEIPFIFLTAEAAIENKIRGLELGVDDYLTKPIYIKEIVTRINILLQKRQRVRFEERRDGRTRFAGRVHDMPVVDVIQTIEISRKSGVIQFVGERGRQAAIYFRDGRVIDAEAGALQGEDAVYRLLTWSEGEFEVVFRTVRRREVIAMSSQALLMEGMRRLDEWSRLFEQLPPLTHRFEVDTGELAARLGDVPDDNNRILRLFDGKRTLLEVIDSSDVGDLECLQAISRLYFEELLLDLDHDSAPRRDTGRSLPLVAIDEPSPLTASGQYPVVAAAAEPAVEPDAPGTNHGEVALAAGAEAAPAVAQAAAESDATPSLARTLSAEVRAGEIGPLMGGYRPSSLRLIDEAVAAAQAIEPTLFDDASAPSPEDVRHGGNGVSRAPATEPAEKSREDDRREREALEGRSREGQAPDGQAPAGLEGSEAPPLPLAAEVVALPRPGSREESGLRMIGSLGRDRAEASGELAPLGTARPRRSETARELVTILPRRNTRDLPVVPAVPVAASAGAPMAAPVASPPLLPPVVTPLPPAMPPEELAESLPTPTPASPVLEPRPSTAPALEIAQPRVTGPQPRVTGPQPRVTGSQRVTLPGSGVRAPSRSRRILRLVRSIERNGPGLGPLLLILLAVVLAGTAVLLRLRRQARSTERIESVQETIRPTATPIAIDTGMTPDAREAPAAADAMGSPPLPTVRDPGSPPLPTVRDPGSPPLPTVRDPGSPPLPTVRAGGAGAPAPAPRPKEPAAARTDTGADKIAEAKVLYDKAHDALEEGDFTKALELADASLKQRRTARTYLLRAQAQQRLDRIDDALASIDAAAQLAPNFGTVWELRGRILWAARRRDDARAAFEKFLELDPDSPKAPAVRRLMNEPR
jgi:CheY-like chemotaxis protein